MILSLCLPVILVLVLVKDLYDPVIMFTCRIRFRPRQGPVWFCPYVYLSYSFSSSSRICMVLSLCLPVIFILVLVKDLNDPVLVFTCHIGSRPRQGPV